MRFAAFSAALSLICLTALLQAAPLQAEPRLSREELILYASNHSLCGELAVLDATRRADGKIAISCGPATGFVPAFGAIALSGGIAVAAAGLALAASAGGGGGTTPSTTAD